MVGGLHLLFQMTKLCLNLDSSLCKVRRRISRCAHKLVPAVLWSRPIPRRIEYSQTLGSNTYLIGTGAQRILIDTAVGLPVWLSSLRSVLADEQCTVAHALITHYHPDHIGGIRDLLAVNPDTAIHKCIPSEPGPSTPVDTAFRDVLRPLAPGQTLRVPGASIRTLPCPGHTPDHLAFVLEPESAEGVLPSLDTPRAVFTGDAVLGNGTAVFNDLVAYEKCLEALAAECAAPDGDAASAASPRLVRGYPGHGVVIPDLGARVAQYQTHRELREREVLRAMREGARTPAEIVAAVYTGLEGELRNAAEKGVRLVLKKLEAEGRVQREDGDRWVIVED